jgi:peptidoglycan/xylan/chitin deacetylase (PgdA/CDA1 family)
LIVLVVRKRRLPIFLVLLIFFMVLTCLIWKVGQNQPQPCVQPQDVIGEVETSIKAVAFTFDDGPSPQGTRGILNVLAQHQAKATFFMVGTQIEKYPHLVKEVQLAGQEIGNHSYSHDYNIWDNPEVAIQDLKKSEQLIYTLTGQRPFLYRPPGGFINEKMMEASKEHNFRIVTWSWIQDTKDWKSPPAERQAAHIIKHIKPGQILLFHDGWGDRSQTIKAVDICMEKLSAQGYQFVTVSELIRLENQE